MYPICCSHRTLAAASVAMLAGGCAALSQDTVLKGAVARVEGERVLITPTMALEAGAGEEVLVYQLVEQQANDPYRNPWHIMKRVATGVVAESGSDGVWITVRSGTVAPRGEIQLRKDR
jgi:hypothetical protein